MSVFCESQFFGFGDSGQGDILMGKKMLEEDVEAQRDRVVVRGVYIQDVVLADGLTFKTPASGRTELLRDGVVLCDTYIDVALDMHARLNVLSAAAMRRVTTQAIWELLSTRSAFEAAMAPMWTARCTEMLRQAARVNEILQKQGEPLVDVSPLAAEAPVLAVSAAASIEEIEI
jgi:hypothetical protein